MLHRIRIWIRGFFGFSRKETNAFLILLPLMTVILVSEPVYRQWKFRNDNHNFFDQHYADSVLATLTYRDSLPAPSQSLWQKEVGTKPIAGAKREAHFTAFDPNTVSEKELVALGLSPFIASRIVRYREKGGRFKSKDDLLRIYGMDTTWFRKASPWITLAEKPPHTTEWKRAEKKITIAEVIDINAADSIQLVKVFGIGPALSRRIRNYREKLGGFVSLNQLSEVYGLDTVALKELKKRFVVSPEFTPRQVSVNSESIEELSHPYIKKKEAQAIVNYRRQHGNFQSIGDVLKIQVLSAGWFENVKPYLKQ
jgi:competence protein ComEA